MLKRFVKYFSKLFSKQLLSSSSDTALCIAITRGTTKDTALTWKHITKPTRIGIGTVQLPLSGYLLICFQAPIKGFGATIGLLTPFVTTLTMPREFMVKSLLLPHDHEESPSVGSVVTRVTIVATALLCESLSRSWSKQTKHTENCSMTMLLTV